MPTTEIEIEFDVPGIDSPAQKAVADLLVFDSQRYAITVPPQVRGQIGTFTITAHGLADEFSIGNLFVASLPQMMFIDNIEFNELRLKEVEFDIVNENEVFFLDVSFTAWPNPQHETTVYVDWGDGTIERCVVPRSAQPGDIDCLEESSTVDGVTTATLRYLYPDDDPSGTDGDPYPLRVKLNNPFCDTFDPVQPNCIESELIVDAVTVSNQIPVIADDLGAQISLARTTITEGDRPEIIVRGQLFDASPDDTHEVFVVWPGDQDDPDNGFTEVATIIPGTRDELGTTFSFAIDPTAHDLYQDDHPTETPQDTVQIEVIVRDDDLGEVRQLLDLTVVNADPVLTSAPRLIRTNEPNGDVTVELIDVAWQDRGIKDSFIVVVEWPDPFGFIQEVTVDANIENDGTWDFASLGLEPLRYTYPAGSFQFPFGVQLTIRDDDSGETGLSIPLAPFPPEISEIPDQVIAEGAELQLDVSFLDDEDPPEDGWTYTVDWGDGTVEGPFNVTTIDVLGTDTTPTEASFFLAHRYGNDLPVGQAYSVVVEVEDRFGGRDIEIFEVDVLNVPPIVNAFEPLGPFREGDPISFAPLVEFTDPGFTESYLIDVHWGDGNIEFNLSPTSLVQNSSPPNVGSEGSLQTIHHFPDNGTYNVEVLVRDGTTAVLDSFMIDIVNAEPVVTGPTAYNICEGQRVDLSLLQIMFSDLGWTNPFGANPGVESFSYTIDWGDGSALETVVAAPAVQGSPGVPTTGQIQGTHYYAANGNYTILIEVEDDDGGIGTYELPLTVCNLPPFPWPIPYPGFNAPASPGRLPNPGPAPNTTPVQVPPPPPIPPQHLVEGDTLNAAHLVRVFSYGYDDPDAGLPQVTIDWGDNHVTGPFATMLQSSGGDGIPSSFVLDPLFANHTYADNGTYTVTIVATDADGDSEEITIPVIVANEVPTLVYTGPSNVQIVEGDRFSLDTLITISDPGFLDGIAGVDETFNYTVDWGDGSPLVEAIAPVTQLGASGQPTLATITDSHVYGNGRLETVIRVTVQDDDGGNAIPLSIPIEVLNAGPIVTPTFSTVSATYDEGTIYGFGQAAMYDFIDPAFNQFDPSIPIESYSFKISWGDGTSSVGNIPADHVVNGSEGVPTLGVNPSLGHSHVWKQNPLPDEPPLELTIKVFDNDGGSGSAIFQIDVVNLPPEILSVTPLAPQINEGTAATFDVELRDPGHFDEMTLTVDWGDGTVDTIQVAASDTATTVPVSHVYPDDSVTNAPSDPFTVTFSLTDDEGATATSVVRTVTVDNVAPTVTASANQSTATAGSAINFVSTFTDPAGVLDGPFVTLWNFGDGSTSSAVSPSHTYNQPGVYSATVTVTDKDGQSGTDSVSITISPQAGVTPPVTPVENEITVDQVRQSTTAAIARWTAAGLEASHADRLRDVRLEVADLTAPYLAWTVTTGNETAPVIWVDPSAGGHGWFVDSTPADDSEFVDLGDGTLAGQQSSDAAGGVDLLSVLIHEFGHVLGLADVDHEHSLMSSILQVGVRVLPDTEDVSAASLIPIVDGKPIAGPALNAEDSLRNGDFAIPVPTDDGFAWETRGDVTVDGSNASLRENGRLLPRLWQPFVVPADATELKVSISDITLRKTVGQPGDAFEIALLSSEGPLSSSTITGISHTDSLLNVQHDGVVTFADSVRVEGLDSSSNLTGRPIDVYISLQDAGDSTTTLYFDLLGFGDIDSFVTIDNVELITGDQPADKIQDVTDDVKVDFFGRQFNRKTGVFATRATITNNSDSHLAYPIRLALTNLTPEEAEVVNAHGILEDGTPYFDFGSQDLGGAATDSPAMLAPGETSADLIIAIKTAARTAYEFQPQVLAAIPEVVTESVDVDIFGRQYNRSNDTFGFYMTVQNNSANELSYPIRVLLDNLQPVGAEVTNAHGTLSDGTPYFDLWGDGALKIGESTGEVVVAVQTPEGRSYAFDPRILSAVCYDHNSVIVEHPSPIPLLQNERDRFDVNADGQVSALDALNVINLLGRTGEAQVPPDLAAAIGVDGAMWVDVNGDGSGTALDALQVVNELARRRSVESEQSRHAADDAGTRSDAVDQFFSEISQSNGDQQVWQPDDDETDSITVEEYRSSSSLF